MSANAVQPVFAHIAAGRSSGLAAWDWGLLLLPAAAVLLWWHGRGVLRLWRRAGVGHGIERWRVASFAAGVVCVCVALVGPMDDGAARSFALHMTQHMMLVLIAAPLIVLGTPVVPLLAGAPRDVRGGVVRWRRTRSGRRLLRALTDPPTTLALYGGMLLFWHVPSVYDATLSNGALHASEHTLLLATATLSWWVLLAPRRQRRLGYGAAVLFVFALMLECTALGGLFTLAPRPLYSGYANTQALFGMSPEHDQQVGGAIMGTLAAAVYLSTAATLFLRWLGESPADRSGRRTRLAPPMAALPYQHPGGEQRG